MADYYPLVARAVAGLERNTGEARRALYERARTALVAQLRGVVPALDESDITRERLGLEEAIRKVEAEAARRTRAEPAAATPAPPAAPQPQPAPPQVRETVPPRAEPRPAQPRAAPQPPGEPRAPAPPRAAPQPQPPARAPAPPAPPRAAPAAPRASLRDDGLRDFRESVGHVTPAEPAPPPPMPPRRPSRDPLAGMPTAHDFDRLEPGLDPEALRTSLAPQPVFPDEVDYEAEQLAPARARPTAPASEEGRRKRGGMPLALGALIKVLISVVLIIGLGSLAYWQRGMISGLYQAFRGQPAQTARDTSTSPGRPKIADRIGPGPATTTPQANPAAPAVAQRVVLYEEEANDPQGKRYIGSVIWRTETVAAGAGKPPDLAVRADVEIPERRLNMTFSIRRNADQTLPASHTVEIMFNLPADFVGGGIANVPGILMKQAEQTRGVPLAGLAVKVTSGFFLIGLSAVESDFQRNIALLKERPWFDVPIVYNNNRRAILALEKGTPGERAFAEAFAAWKQ